jgi:hypothetical protein
MQSSNAVEVLKLLNALFSHFDAVVLEHGLEPLKTIGSSPPPY